MNVIAAKGLKCPKENKPREYITDSTPVDVPESHYYLRLVADGSLVLAPAAKPTAQASKGGDSA
jgi:hypothetical protein